MTRGTALLLAAALPATALAEVDGVAAEAEVLAGDSRDYKPLLTFRPGAMRVAAPLSATLRSEGVQAFATDAAGTAYAPDAAFDTQLRVGAVFDTEQALSPIFFHAEYEHDLLTGQVSGGAADDFGAVDPALGGDTDTQLRKAFGRLTVGPFVTLSGGFQTSHWGLGLLANDGDHGWTPGSAYFGDPRGGDRVLRSTISTGPWTRGRVVLTFGYDVVQGDDVILGDDEATQFIAAAVVNHGKPRTVGMYAAFRDQEAPDGKKTEVAAIDLYGKWTGRIRGKVKYTTELEWALVTGTTELAPTPEKSEHDVLQMAVAARLGFDFGGLGTVLDFIYASGDRNFDDGAQNSFKADPNFEMGLLLYRYVLATTSARSAVTAADPDLVGVPSEDLDRYPFRGSVTNTVAFFPRAWWRPVAGLEVYGGPLIAFTNVSYADPRESRFEGGRPTNPFGGEPGAYLGTELDLGVRYRVIAFGSELTLGLEGGVLQPGDALADADDETIGPVTGGRAILSYRL